MIPVTGAGQQRVVACPEIGAAIKIIKDKGVSPTGVVPDVVVALNGGPEIARIDAPERAPHEPLRDTRHLWPAPGKDIAGVDVVLRSG